MAGGRKRQKRGNNDSSVNEEEQEQLKTPSSQENSSKRKRNESSSKKNTRSSCRRRLTEALEFGQQLSEDENNNASIEQGNIETLNSPQLVLQGKSIENSSIDANRKIKQTKNYRPNENKIKQSKTESRVYADSVIDFKMTVDPGEDNLDGSSSKSEMETQSNESSEEEERIVEVTESQEEILLVNNPEVQSKRRKIEWNDIQQKIQNRPDIQEMMMEMLQETLKDDNKNSSQEETGKMPSNTNHNRNMRLTPNKTEIKPIKSPSDTTIYVPALKKKHKQDLSIEKPDLSNKIAEFVNNMRIEQFPEDEDKQDQPKPSTSRHRDSLFEKFDPERERRATQEAARRRANEIILEAERQKAAIAQPTGMIIPNNNIIEKTLNHKSNSEGVPMVDNAFNDDDASNFCQVTCHVDTNTTSLIKKGGLVDLDKISPNEKNAKISTDENRIEFVNKDGKTYFVPCNDRENTNKINGIRSWEKAFRVYAAIYTQANPHRGAEIYQYVHSINLAAASYQWENVAYYDFQFRSLMSQNPQRSWAKVHNQLWTLSMRDVKIQGDRAVNNRKSSNNSGSDRETVCWRFNHNQCKRSANNCKFEHRCSFCGVLNHSYLNCHKRKKVEKGNHNTNNDKESSNHKSNK